MLLVQALHYVWAVTITLVSQQTNDKLCADRYPEVVVLWIPKLAQQCSPIPVALVNPYRESDDREVYWHLHSPCTCCRRWSALNARSSLGMDSTYGMRDRLVVAAIRRMTRPRPRRGRAELVEKPCSEEGEDHRRQHRDGAHGAALSDERPKGL
eukprot:scaffold171316_cov34-Tisochrysis_lutea.AAC.1